MTNEKILSLKKHYHDTLFSDVIPFWMQWTP